MLTRRFVLKSGAMTLASLGAGPAFLDRLAAAVPSGGSHPPVLVTIFLRGAMDALMAVPPIDDPLLARFRPSLAAGHDAVHDLDGRFGLHPSLSPLLPLFADRRLAIVHATGSPNPTRSHFDAQDLLETGTPWRLGTPSGWLNRTLERAPGARHPFRAVALADELPRVLSGDEPALAIANLADFELRLPFAADDAASLGDALQDLYRRRGAGRWSRPGEQMFESLRVLASNDLLAYRAARLGRYPETGLGRSLLQIAFLIKAGVGLQVAFAESTGWDTHAAQSGTFSYHAGDLASSLAAFWEDIEPYQDHVVVLALTEFGRTVRENGSRGTDHGHGSCLFALGNRVDGGKVYGEFPGLAPEVLFEGRDLPVTTDFRAVLSDVITKLYRFRDADLFPGWVDPPLPILW